MQSQGGARGAALLLTAAAIVAPAVPAVAGTAAPAAGPSADNPAADNPAAESPAVGADDAGAAETIIVTGIRGGKPRTVAESPAPIDVVQGEQLSGPGRADLAETLSKILPSISFGTTTAGINSIVRPIFNRGLGPAYTLVLVNGKRRHNGALLTNGGGDTSGVNPVDFDQLPMSSIDYIEVLKDSAAAQYGSDAVAGVVNIVFKSQDHGGHVALLGGSLYGGKGSLGTYKAEADVGFKLGQDGGFVHIGADARKRGLTWNNFFAANLPFSPASDPRNATWNGDGAHNGDPEIRSYSTNYNAELPVSDAVTLYSFGTFGQRETKIGNNYRRPNGTASFAAIFENGFYPLNNTAETDYQIVGGVKGEVAGAKWDLSTSYGRDHVRQYSDLTINPSLGPTSPTSFDELATYRFEQVVTNLDVTRGFDVGLAEPLQVSGGAEYRIDKFSTFAGDPLGYTNGGYVFQPGDQPGDPNVGRPASIGAQAGVVLSPADEARLTRKSIAGYLDLGLTPVRGWYVGGAVRVEHYDDAAGTTVGFKLNSRYDITDWIALRGAVGTGFRAPSLTQIGYAQTDSRTGIDPTTGAIVPSLTKLARNESALARALGAEDLKAEKSTNFGLGLVLRPVDRVNLTIDAYQVAVNDRIARTGTLLGPALAPLLAASGSAPGTWVTYFANAADTRTRGIDIVADYALPLGSAGRLHLDAAINYNRTRITEIVPTPAALAALGANPGGSLIFFPRASIGDLTVNLPRLKLVAGARWTAGRFGVNLRSTRYDSYDWVRSEVAAQDTHYAARWITDLDVTAAIAAGFKVTVGAANILNVRPQKSGPGDPATGSAQFVYGPSPFSPAGGFYYGKLSFDF